ncbi:hypothetical protein NCS55_00900600 [Fusarium keratoplasticum]|nr:hypothetical protein NCS55_00900600 [Fusarium keratoplasticum]
MDVPSFTLRFKALSDDPTQPVQNCQLHIVSSDVVEVFANCASATIDTEGKWYQADAFGVVSVIVSTADMASFTLQVDQFQAVGGQPLKRIDNNPKVYNLKGKRPTILAGIVGDNTPRKIERFLDRLSETSWYDPWGFFSWCYEKPKQATSWILQKIGNALSLVIEIAGTVYKFILDGVEVGKAMSWVFEKITVGVQRLIDFVGFIFQWGDILDTSDSIVASINAGLGYAQDKVAYGGMAQSGKINGAADLMSAMPTLEDGTTLQDLWNDLPTIFQTLYYYITAIGGDVSDLFTPTTTSTDAYNKLKLDLINAAVDTTQNVLDLLAIELPIFTALWKAIAGGRDFAVFNAFSLLMAIPVTFVYKVVDGTALPSLKGMDKTTFAAYVNGTLGDDDSDFGITRTQIQIVGFAIAVTAIHLEVDFQLISWVTKKIQGLAAVTIDTGLIFVGVAMLIIGWPVAGQKDMGMRFIIIVNNDSEPSDLSLLARHIVEDTFDMIKAWLASVGEVVEDIKVKAVAKGLGYAY